MGTFICSLKSGVFRNYWNLTLNNYQITLDIESESKRKTSKRKVKNFRKICRLQSAKNLGNVITIHRNHVRLSLPPDFKNLFLERNRFNSNQVKRIKKNKNGRRNRNIRRNRSHKSCEKSGIQTT